VAAVAQDAAEMSGELAGTLRERVEVQRRDGARDAIGGAVGDWVSLGTAWAAIEFDRAGAGVAADAADASPWWRVTMRARDISVGDRMLWGGRVLAVRSVERDPRFPDRLRARAEEAR
jgi:head-tail adaptor